MTGRLTGKKVAILLANGFEQVEMTEPRTALQQEGAQTYLISPQSEQIKGWNQGEWGDTFPVDVPLGGKAMTNANDYDALFLPGGVMNPDELRTNAQAVQFMNSFFEVDKPVAAICHGLWMLIEADVVKGRTLTSWPSLQVDIENAGGTWLERQVVRDKNLVTSRMPADIPQFFNPEMIELFATWQQKS